MTGGPVTLWCACVRHMVHAYFSRLLCLVQVVLLRSGVLVHINKYMQTLGLLPLDIPEKAKTPEPNEDAATGDDEPAPEPEPAGMLHSSSILAMGMLLNHSHPCLR